MGKSFIVSSAMNKFKDYSWGSSRQQWGNTFTSAKDYTVEKDGKLKFEFYKYFKLQLLSENDLKTWIWKLDSFIQIHLFKSACCPQIKLKCQV